MSMNDAQLRFLWRKSIWPSLTISHSPRDAFEAWRNSRADHPPKRWRSGVRIVEEE